MYQGRSWQGMWELCIGEGAPQQEQEFEYAVIEGFHVGWLVGLRLALELVRGPATMGQVAELQMDSTPG